MEHHRDRCGRTDISVDFQKLIKTTQSHSVLQLSQIKALSVQYVTCFINIPSQYLLGLIFVVELLGAHPVGDLLLFGHDEVIETTTLRIHATVYREKLEGNKVKV